jgi:hypothetical protein
MMRSIRVRELMLVVVVVALAFGWWLDRSRLSRQLTQSDARSREAMAMAEDWQAQAKQLQLVRRVSSRNLNACLEEQERLARELAECRQEEQDR